MENSNNKSMGEVLLNTEEISLLNNFEYSCFKFKFKNKTMTDLAVKQILTYINYHIQQNDLYPWDLANFLLRNKVKFSINFKFCKGISIGTNFALFKEVLRLKKELIRCKFQYFFYYLTKKIFN